MSDEMKADFAWTATHDTADYRHFPPYVNLVGNRLAVRGAEKFNGDYYEHGDYVAVELPDAALNDLRNALNDTHPRTTGDSDLVEANRDFDRHEELVARVCDAIGALKMGSSLEEQARAAIAAIEATLSTQAAEIERLRAVLERTDDFIVNELAGEMPTMDFCQANPEAGSLLLEIRQALSDTSGSAE